MLLLFLVEVVVLLLLLLCCWCCSCCCSSSSSSSSILQDCPAYGDVNGKPGLRKWSSPETLGINSSTEKDCRHPQDWTDDLNMAWERTRRRLTSINTVPHGCQIESLWDHNSVRNPPLRCASLATCCKPIHNGSFCQELCTLTELDVCRRRLQHVVVWWDESQSNFSKVWYG